MFGDRSFGTLSKISNLLSKESKATRDNFCGGIGIRNVITCNVILKEIGE